MIFGNDLAAAQLADRARSRVPTNDDSLIKPGELLDEARSLLVAAEELVEKAIIFERERGTSWARSSGSASKRPSRSTLQPSKIG
jgi:hypothetical protein